MAQSQSAPASKIASAGRRCMELLHRVTLSLAIVGSALELQSVSDLLEEKMRHLHLSGASGIRDFLSVHKIITPIDDGKPFNVDEVMPLVAKSLAKQAAVNAEMVISAAVVILSHSTADDVFTEVCKLAIDLDPEKWIPLLDKETKVTLQSVKDLGADGVFEEELRKLGIRIGAKSLTNRAKMLFSLVRIQPNSQMLKTDPDYFDMSKLKEADQLRVKLVHGNGLPNIDPAAGTKFSGFLHEAATTAVRSIVTVYEIPPDREHWLTLVTPPKEKDLSDEVK